MKFSTTTIDTIANKSFTFIKKELDESNWMQYVDENKLLFYMKNGKPYVVQHEQSPGNFQSRAVQSILATSNIQEAIHIIGSDPFALINEEKGNFIGYITQHH